MNSLTDEKLQIIFTYAPAGLGHLRVTDAFFEGLPEGAKPVILGSEDRAVGGLHRITSVHPSLRRLMEWVQRGRPEDGFTWWYRRWLTKRTKKIYRKLKTVLNQAFTRPEKVLIVATHFGLAHQIAAIKDRVEKEEKIKIFLVVQVTDDSPQHLWLVPKADLTLVPSSYTKKGLEDYAKGANLEIPQIEVLPYPMNPKLISKLSQSEYKSKTAQLKPESNEQIKMAVPISGAAVGLNYFMDLTKQLKQSSSRWHFSIVSRDSGHTMFFLNAMAKREDVSIYKSQLDRDVVDEYEELYQNQVMALEITKPSEQAFKALIGPKRRGGSVLIFSEPVGRQEYDNLNFLTRHDLIPNPGEQKQLFELIELGREAGKTWLKKAKDWRGVKVSPDPLKSARQIEWYFNQGLFLNMAQGSFKFCQKSDPEVCFRGVELFWERMRQLLNGN